MSEFVTYLLPPQSALAEPPAVSFTRALPGVDRATWCGQGRFRWAINRNHPVRTARVCNTARLCAIGDVRLDNRREIAVATDTAEDCSDILLLTRFVEKFGPTHVHRLLGDFSVVIWDDAAQQLLAIRDALGVKALYFSEIDGALAFASRAGLLSFGRGWDLEYIAEYLVGGDSGGRLTIYTGVHMAPTGTVLRTDNGSIHETRYWDPRDYTPRRRLPPADLYERFRSLFADAVRARIDGSTTWSHLSGGMDSSSVVSMAQHLADRGDIPSGLGGTITIVDDVGFREEQGFADAVLAMYPVRNKRITTFWGWQDGPNGPPLTDQPDSTYPYYALIERMCAAALENDGTVMLSGLGADNYLKGNLLFVADLLGTGHLLEACTTVAQWAVATRQSFWRLAFRNGILPLLPAGLRVSLSPKHKRVQSFINPDFVRRFDLQSRLSIVRKHRAKPGGISHEALCRKLRNIPEILDRGVSQELIEMRYPFVSRPLIEMSLQTPPDLRATPKQLKVLLRESMIGILPERVRTRTAKATGGAQFVQSISKEKARLLAMLRDPLLAQMGCIEPGVLRQSVIDLSTGRIRRYSTLVGALSLETWLRSRSGQWVSLESKVA